MKQESETTVADFMTREVFTLHPDDTMFQASDFFISHRIAGAPVVDDEKHVLGVLSETDCLRFLLGREREKGELVRDHMTDLVWTVEKRSSIANISSIMLDTKLRRLPVLEDGKLAGQISISDCIQALRKD